MRFGISATSSIFPKNLRTRLRPVNVCAIVASLLPPTAHRGGGVFRRTSKVRAEDVQGGGKESIPPSSARSRPLQNVRVPGIGNSCIVRFAVIGANQDHI